MNTSKCRSIVGKPPGSESQKHLCNLTEREILKIKRIKGNIEQHLHECLQKIKYPNAGAVKTERDLMDALVPYHILQLVKEEESRLLKEKPECGSIGELLTRVNDLEKHVLEACKRGRWDILSEILQSQILYSLEIGWWDAMLEEYDNRMNFSRVSPTPTRHFPHWSDHNPVSTGDGRYHWISTIPHQHIGSRYPGMHNAPSGQTPVLQEYIKYI